MDPEEEDPAAGGGGGSKGVTLAIAVLLLWLAGVCLWVAFEGASFLPDVLPVGPNGKPSYWLGIVQGLAGKAQALQQQGQSNDSGSSTGGG